MAIKSCGRCRQNFDCKADEIANCDCNQIKLNPDTLEFLRKTKFDCLCNTCLQEMNQLVLEASRSKFPKHPEQLIENRHYTIENGLFVFTEFYLMQRGHCCENRCRNCPYGYSLPGK